MVKKGKRGWGSTINDVGRATYLALKTAQQVAKRARTYTRTSTGTSNPAKAITSQHDSKQLYRRRKKSRRMVRKFARRYKNFLSQQLKAACMKQFLCNLAETSTSQANHQKVMFIASGALEGLNSECVGNLHNLVENQIEAVPENTTFKSYLIGMNIDYTITNDSAGTMELDVYDWRTKKDRRLEATSIHSSYSEGFLEQKLISASTGTNSKVEHDDLGVTPFMNPEYCKTFTINGKRRFYISPGQTISWTDNVVFRKPYLMDSAIFNQLYQDSSHSFVLAGVTRGVLLIFKGVPSGSNLCGDPVTLRHCSQTNYRYKVLCADGNKTEIGYN